MTARSSIDGPRRPDHARLILYALPTGDWAAMLNRTRAGFALAHGRTEADRYPLHVTLTGSFDVPRSAIDEVVRVAQRCGIDEDGLVVRVAGARHDRASRWLGLPIEGEALQAVAARFAAAVPTERLATRIRPKTNLHLSLAYGDVDVGVLEAIPEALDDALRRSSVQALDLALLEHRPGDLWTTHWQRRAGTSL